MSTPTTTTSPSGPGRIGGADLPDAEQPIGFGRLVGVELRKMADTRAGKWLLGLTVALVVLVMTIVLLVGVTQDVTVGFETFLASTTFSAGVLLPVLGILLLTQEWGQRTAMVTFTLVPHRGRVIGSKLVAAVTLALIAAGVSLVAAAVVNGLFGLINGGTSWHVDAVFYLGFVAVQVVSILSGFAFAALFLNSAAAIVVWFVVSYVLPTVFSIGAALIGWFADVQPWIDFSTDQNAVLSSDVTGSDWAHLAVSGLIWLVLPLAVGLARVLRAEVK